MSLGFRFCMSGNDGTGGGGWVHPKGANSMVVSELTCRKALVGTGRAISVLFGINGLGNKPSYPVGPRFLAFTAHFSATPGSLDWEFVNWWVWLALEIVLYRGCLCWGVYVKQGSTVCFGLSLHQMFPEHCNCLIQGHRECIPVMNFRDISWLETDPTICGCSNTIRAWG